MSDARRLAGLVTSARLTVKVNRFELGTGVVVALAAGLAALFVRSQLEAVGATEDCLLRWVASLTTTVDCSAQVQVWSNVNETGAGKVMAAMLLVPWVVGVLAGVPLVARELESGTAAVAWALAGSRRRWLVRQAAPILLLVIVVTSAAAIPAALLAETRSAGGVWSSTFADADLFGLPVVARAIAAIAIGLACGALIGRILPALIVSLAIAALVVSSIGTIEQSVVHSAYNETSIGGPGDVASFIAANPDIDVRFVTTGERVLSLDAALASVPAGVPDAMSWLQDHYQFVTLGVRSTKTIEWQLIESAILVVLSAGFGGLALAVVGRRSPR